MKKICCLLFILHLFSASYAFADQHFEMQCSFSGTDRTETVDLYEQNGEIIAVSTLFPEYTAVVKTNQSFSISEMSGILAIDPLSVIEFINSLDNLTMTWLDPLLSVPETDIFAGDLFESAHTVQCCSIRFSEWTSFVKNNLKSDLYRNIFYFIAESIHRFCGSGDPAISVQCFDNGRYITVAVLDGENVNLLVSADRSLKEKHHIMISWRETGRYYFKEYYIREEQGSVIAQSSLRSGSGSSYSMVAGNTPLYNETFSVSKETGSSVGFSWTLQSDALKKPLIMEGVKSETEAGIIQAEAVAYIGEPSVSLMSLSLRLEPEKNTEFISDRQIIHLDNTEEVSVISLSAAASIMSLSAEIMHVLPEDYQKLMLNMIYP